MNFSRTWWIAHDGNIPAIGTVIAYPGCEETPLLTDIRPVVEKILRQLVLAGLPVMAVACGDGRGTQGRDAGSESGASGGATATGGSGSGGRANTAGRGGGADGNSSGGAGGIGGGGPGGGGTAGTGAGGTGQPVTCVPISFSCGTPSPCPPFLPDGGAFGIPLTTATLNFDPNDSRWAALYRACASPGSGGACSPECTGLCRTLVASHGLTTFFEYNYHKCDITCGQDAQLTAVYEAGVCGRRSAPCVPGQRFRPRAPRARVLGEHLARAAELEAESVPAFSRLARDLAAHGAPADLIHAAHVAMKEEARHWRRTRDLARRRGGHPVKPPLTISTFNSLEDVAVDNVIEGCVRETYGALVAAHQAAEANDADVRRLMTDIAVDEMSHAALSWKVDAWATERLGPAFRARRESVALAAVAELIAGVRAFVPEKLREAAGLPAAEEAQALLLTVSAGLWAPNFTTVAAPTPSAAI